MLIKKNRKSRTIQFLTKNNVFFPNYMYTLGSVIIYKLGKDRRERGWTINGEFLTTSKAGFWIRQIIDICFLDQLPSFDIFRSIVKESYY